MLYPWLKPAWQQLMNYHQKQRMPGALLISASTDLGQKNLMDNFAQSIFCTQPAQDHQPCGICASCHLFEAGHYPDYLVLEPAEGDKDIKIDAVRNMCADLAFNTQFDRHRFAVLNPADVMTHAASNSLLKTLEEPSRDTTIVLLTERPNRLPATIRSRCQNLHLEAEQAPLQSWLQEQGCNQAEAYLKMANDSPIRAHHLWQSKAFELREKLYKSLHAIFLGRLDPLAVHDQFKGHYPLPVLDFMMQWIMALIRLQSTNQSLENSTDVIDNNLQEIQGQLDLRALFELLDMLRRAKQNQFSQLNKQLEFEEILISWWQMSQPNINQKVVKR